MGMFSKKSVPIFACVFQIISQSVAKTTMVVKRHNINDQAVSGSGYSYSVHSGDPDEYQKGRSMKILEDLGYDSKLDSSPDLQRYGKEHHLPPFSNGYHHTEHHAPPIEFDDYKFDVNNVLYHVPHSHGFSDDGYIGYPYAPGYKHHYPHDYEYPQYEHPLYEDHFEDSDFLKHKHDHGEDFSKKGGKNYEGSEYANHGENDNKGYNKKDKFEKGIKGKHEDFDKKSYYGQKGDHKDSHYDKQGHYDENFAKGGSNQGGSYSEDSGHKKGQQTKGYHKVLHKDEYKKEHKFYDQADKNGYYDKFGNFKKHHDMEKGNFKEGGSSDAGYDEKNYGEKDTADKGHYAQKDEGFQKEKGQEEYFNGFSDFGSKGGEAIAEEEGYNQ